MAASPSQIAAAGAIRSARRQLVRFTYAAGRTLIRAGTDTIKRDRLDRGHGDQRLADGDRLDGPLRPGPARPRRLQPPSTGAQGPTGGQGATGATGTQGSNGQNGAQGPRGPAGKDGSFSFLAKDASVSVRRGRILDLSFRIANDTSARVGRSTATASAPAALRLRGPRSFEIDALKAGESRTVHLRLKVGANAALGRQAVKVELEVGGRSATRGVTVIVTR